MTIGVMFVDVRGSTRLGEELDVLELAGTLNEFYDRVTKVVVRHGIVDKLIGDEVMGIYIPPLSPGGRFIESLVADARDVLRALGYGTATGPLLEVGIGLDVGEAFVGKVGGDEVGDFTALGDVVNTAARLQAVAGPGEIVVNESIAELAGIHDDEGRRVELDLKGKLSPVAARILASA